MSHTLCALIERAPSWTHMQAARLTRMYEQRGIGKERVLIKAGGPSLRHRKLT